MNGKLTYIFGHKNPDTDSICGAISLSYLKNKLGMNTIPSALGNLNSETKYSLDYFKAKEPFHLNDVKLQIKDVAYHKNCFIDKNVPIKDAFDYMNKYSLTGIPVVENKNKYYGYVSLKEVAKEIITGDFHKINTSYGNLISTLNGEKIFKFDKEITGNVLVAAYAKETFLEKVELDNTYIVVVGDRKTILDYAINSRVKLIILVQSVDISDDLLKKAKKNKVNIIKTPFSSYEVAKTISFSNYIKEILRKEESVTFNELDYLSDFIEATKKLKHTNYPILNNRNECKGLLTLTDTNDVDKKQVILVDHNNYSQSVDGLEEAEILEVIDHHNIGDINTKRPINFRNAGVGSVNTIIYDLYKENNIKVPKDIAGLMASAIISDTLLLTSPTTTIRDVDALTELSKIAKIKYKKYGTELLKQGMSIKGLTNYAMLHKDFKTYKIKDSVIGIGQLLTADLDLINKKMNSIVKYLDEVSVTENMRVVALFITDIFENQSYCIYNTSAKEIIKNSFDLKEVYEGVALKNILSRKMQIAPYIMDTIEKE